MYGVLGRILDLLELEVRDSSLSYIEIELDLRQGFMKSGHTATVYMAREPYDHRLAGSYGLSGQDISLPVVQGHYTRRAILSSVLLPENSRISRKEE